MRGTAYYDLGRNPPSYNFVDFLLQAEAWRIAGGLDGLDVAVVPGPQNGFRADDLPPAGGAVRSQWRDNIVLPMPRLLPSCGRPAVLVDRKHRSEGPEFGRGEYLCGFYRLVQMAQQGVYPFVCPEDEIAAARARHGHRYVTVTLRQVEWWPNRTSRIDEWRAVARELERRGYKAVFIPDGTKPDHAVDGFATDPEAARHVVARAALYAGAVMNFGIPSGPMWLAWFMGAPTIVVRMIIEEDRPTSAAAYARNGLPPGTQLRNARSRQRLVWADERADVILAAFDELEGSIARERILDAGADLVRPPRFRLGKRTKSDG